jgi:hypothetical protein
MKCYPAHAGLVRNVLTAKAYQSNMVKARINSVTGVKNARKLGWLNILNKPF